MIRNLLISIFSLLAALSVYSADLTSRIQMENSLQTRIENLMRAYDTNSQVILRIEYQKYKNDLPGSTFNYTHGVTPNTLETNDLLSIQVTIISDVIQKLSPQFEQAILNSLPVEKNKIKLNLTTHAEQVPTPAYPLQSKEVSHISDQFIQNLSKIILYSLLGVCLFSALVIFIYARMRSKNQKDSSLQITSALEQLAQNGLGSNQTAALPLNNSNQQVSSVQSSSQDHSSNKNYLNELPTNSLKEILADCYWSSEDQYAHFVWQHLSFDKKNHLVNELSFLKKYAAYFSQVPASEKNYHNHPYYLNPASLSHLSNASINEILEKNLSLWNTLSPIRQSQMQLTFEQRIQSLELNVPTLHRWENHKASEARRLPMTGQCIQLTEKEEKTLYDNISMVPEKFQPLVKSLLWLALNDEKTISAILSRYDARTLASGWTAQADILQKLESCLPEKKLKLLSTYKEKVSPSKESSVYQELIQLGLSAYKQQANTQSGEKINHDDAA